jgi:hypothetical protein
MVLRIRLARFGNKHNPFYNIVVAQARYVAIFSPVNSPRIPIHTTSARWQHCQVEYDLEIPLSPQQELQLTL